MYYYLLEICANSLNSHFLQEFSACTLNTRVKKAKGPFLLIIDRSPLSSRSFGPIGYFRCLYLLGPRTTTAGGDQPGCCPLPDIGLMGVNIDDRAGPNQCPAIIVSAISQRLSAARQAASGQCAQCNNMIGKLP